MGKTAAPRVVVYEERMRKRREKNTRRSALKHEVDCVPIFEDVEEACDAVEAGEGAEVFDLRDQERSE